MRLWGFSLSNSSFLSPSGGSPNKIEILFTSTLSLNSIKNSRTRGLGAVHEKIHNTNIMSVYYHKGDNFCSYCCKICLPCDNDTNQCCIALEELSPIVYLYPFKFSCKG